MTTKEFNFDGLIGPTHNYAGLSYGNVASASHRMKPSRPRAAAIQGLEKMKLLSDRGIGQCVLPPVRRPRFEFLRTLGFAGTDQQLLEKAYDSDPVLLATCYSASNMWTANAATVSPSVDCADGKLHFTTANLSSTLHRSIEAPSTERYLRALFPDEQVFAIHPALPSQAGLSDEGAANHTRLCGRHDQPGIELFVYGVDTTNRGRLAPRKFPARQTLLASQSVARHHGLNPQRTLFFQQNPDAIDAGVFHNDVIAVGNENVLICHEDAFCDQAVQIKRLEDLFRHEFESSLTLIQFSNHEIGLPELVASYFFNSQLVTRSDGGMTLVCPIECQEVESARKCTQRILQEENRVDEVVFLDLRQSMNNGGGPACLRLRVVLTDEQQAAMHSGVVLTESLYLELVDWVNSNYREQLSADDLRDPALVDESLTAMEQLAGILQLPVEVTMDV